MIDNWRIESPSDSWIEATYIKVEFLFWYLNFFLNNKDIWQHHLFNYPYIILFIINILTIRDRSLCVPK